MSNVNNELTETQFNQQMCPLPPKKLMEIKGFSVTEQAAQGSLTGIVTFIKLDDGSYHILSRYEDDEWTFPASKATKATCKGRLTLNFSTINDAQMNRMAKWLVWHKMQNGLVVNSLWSYLQNLKLFFIWVSESEIISSHGLNAFTANTYVQYVNALTIERKGKLGPLNPITKTKRFLVLEDLYQYCKTFDFVIEHPWMQSSASEQAGNIGKVARDAKGCSKTPIIPDVVLTPLCQFTKEYLDKAEELLALRDQLDAYNPNATIHAANQTKEKRRYIQSISKEFDKLDDLNEALVLLRDSCIFWLLLTTGMRIHEVLAIKRGSYRTETQDDITYYYIETVSEKTHTGLAEWIAPEIAKRAVYILERYSEPLQRKLEDDLAKARLVKDHAEAHRLETISDHVCLAASPKDGNAINILSGSTITNFRLPNLCSRINNNWKLAAHQFRRTFANYVVHSELGDLRALKDHFKHWSITMTALYASNDKLDTELFEELLREKYLVEQEIKFDWFNLDTPVTGGAFTDTIKKLRNDKELLKIYGSHQAMAQAYSSSIPIRSTGIGWCTNDDECKCGTPDICESGIIDKTYLPYWEGMLVQQMKLEKLEDIGEAGQAAVAKGMARCERVLSGLGIDVEALKNQINRREQIEVPDVY